MPMTWHSREWACLSADSGQVSKSTVLVRSAMVPSLDAGKGAIDDSHSDGSSSRSREHRQDAPAPAIRSYCAQPQPTHSQAAHVQNSPLQSGH